jgi:biphenyl 2,3-dioxygenase beta subunit
MSSEDGADMTSTAQTTDEKLAAMVRQYEVEGFLYDEAAILDAHRYEEWLSLFADDATYFMPVRRTRMQREMDLEFTKPGEMAFFNDTKPLLAGRVTKLETGRSWSEDPPSRTRRLITNVRVVDDDGTELTVESNFMLYRTRLNSQEDKWIGLRRDVLRRVGASFQIAARTIYLEETVLLSRNLSNFF